MLERKIWEDLEKKEARSEAGNMLMLLLKTLESQMRWSCLATSIWSLTPMVSAKSSMTTTHLQLDTAVEETAVHKEKLRERVKCCQAQIASSGLIMEMNIPLPTSEDLSKIIWQTSGPSLTSWLRRTERGWASTHASILKRAPWWSL